MEFRSNLASSFGCPLPHNRDDCNSHFWWPRCAVYRFASTAKVVNFWPGNHLSRKLSNFEPSYWILAAQPCGMKKSRNNRLNLWSIFNSFSLPTFSPELHLTFQLIHLFTKVPRILNKCVSFSCYLHFPTKNVILLFISVDILCAARFEW